MIQIWFTRDAANGLAEWATRSPWARIGGWLTPGQAIWRPTLSFWVIFFMVTHLKGKQVFVVWKSLKFQFAKVAISPSTVIGSLAPPLVETGSLPQVQWWASWVGASRGFLKHFSAAAGQETRIPEMIPRRIIWTQGLQTQAESVQSPRCYMVMNYHKL